jgi:metal-sulfur cluster biosynthetic enzyme
VAQLVEELSEPGEATRVRDALREVVDPEVGINIVDLGLIYAVEANQRSIRVRMTMTTPSCPMSNMLVEEIHAIMAYHFPGHRIHIDLVWQPPWRPDMMSPIARFELGLAQ